MADDIKIPVGFEDEQRPSLIFAIFNERPIDAAQLGRLLIDLQSDYRRLFGGSLVVGRLETGSNWFSLIADAADWLLKTGTEAAEAIETGQKLLEFAKKIKNSLSRADKASKGLPSPPKDSFVEELQGAESLVKTAEESNGAFQLIIDNAPDGSGRRMFFRYESKDARRISKEFKRTKSARRKQKKLPLRSRIGKAPTEAHISDDASHTALIRDFGQSLNRVSASGSADEIRTLIELIAKTIKSLTGGTHVLEQLAIVMELNAKSEIARMIREHIPPKDRLPPIRTT